MLHLSGRVNFVKQINVFCAGWVVWNRRSLKGLSRSICLPRRPSPAPVSWPPHIPTMACTSPRPGIGSLPSLCTGRCWNRLAGRWARRGFFPWPAVTDVEFDRVAIGEGVPSEHPPGATVVLDETIRFHRPPGTGLILGQPALTQLCPTFEDLGDPGPRGLDGIAAHEA